MCGRRQYAKSSKLAGNQVAPVHVFQQLKQQLFRFLQVGAIGFAVDAGLLWVLIYQVGMSPISARAISVVLAVIATFILNSRYTFAVRAQGSMMVRYVVVQALGAAINFGIYSWLILYGPLENYPLVALLVGAAVSTVSNFGLARIYVFRT